MASPVADSYSVASGAPVTAGRYPHGYLLGTADLASISASGDVGLNAAALGGNAALQDATAGGAIVGLESYPWAASVPTNTFYALSGTNFRTNVTPLIPTGAYQGTNPIDSMVHAYCDPAFDIATKKQYFYGGGHGDGTCNAVVAFDFATLQYSIACAPTPPAKYPPSYVNGGSLQPGPLTYPSGLSGGGYFLPADQLTDSLDTPYATPLARGSSHMYAAACMRGSVIHYFYSTYAEFDTSTGQWKPEAQGVDLGSQLTAFRPQYGTAVLQHGTAAIYDEVTDRFFVTLVPGDSGGGWRTAIMVINPITRTIESVHESGTGDYGYMYSSTNLCKVGRKIYVFLKVPSGSYDSPQRMNSGYIFDMDTKTKQKFIINGDPEGTVFSPGANIETIPSWYDGIAIRRWNYKGTKGSVIHSVNTTPLSGVGTLADPFVLSQTETAISGAVPTVGYAYHRVIYTVGSGCALVLPGGNAEWIAIKLG